MFKRIYVIDVEDVGYRDRESFGMNAGNYDVWSTLLGSSGFQPYSVDITAAFELQGIAYHWQFCAPTAAHMLWLSLRSSTVSVVLMALLWAIVILPLSSVAGGVPPIPSPVLRTSSTLNMSTFSSP
jgi:hypothetical protein